MSADLRHDRNKEVFIELFTPTYSKWLNMSELLLIFWWKGQNVEKLYYLFKLRISFWTSAVSNSLKEKTSPSLNLFLISITLEWFFYFKIALRVWSSIVSMKDVYLQYFKLSRLLRILEKNFSRTSASNSLLTNSFFFRQIYSVSCHDHKKKWWFYCLSKKFVIKDIFFIQVCWIFIFRFFRKWDAVFSFLCL